jgi:hypothetical protein
MGTRMEKQWKNHNVSLQRLKQMIETYYSGRNLKVKETALKDGYSISVVLAKLRVPSAMKIIIRGTPNDFTVETESTEYEDNVVKVGLITTIFGGGSLVLANIKKREELEKLEREFWGAVEEMVTHLTDSEE